MDIGGEGGKSYVALGDVGDLGQGRDLGKKNSIQFNSHQILRLHEDMFSGTRNEVEPRSN